MAERVLAMEHTFVQLPEGSFGRVVDGFLGYLVLSYFPLFYRVLRIRFRLWVSCILFYRLKYGKPIF